MIENGQKYARKKFERFDLDGNIEERKKLLTRTFLKKLAPNIELFALRDYIIRKSVKGRKVETQSMYVWCFGNKWLPLPRYMCNPMQGNNENSLKNNRY